MFVRESERAAIESLSLAVDFPAPILILCERGPRNEQSRTGHGSHQRGTRDTS